MTRIPKLRHHKGRNQAAVVLDGRYFYLGTWGSDAAQRNYDRTIQEWLAMGRRSPITASGVDEVGISITELCVRYFDYANADGFGDDATYDGTGKLGGLDWSSVFAIAVGAQRSIGERLVLRGGYSYNQNPIRGHILNCQQRDSGNFLLSPTIPHTSNEWGDQDGE